LQFRSLSNPYRPLERMATVSESAPGSFFPVDWYSPMELIRSMTGLGDDCPPSPSKLDRQPSLASQSMCAEEPAEVMAAERDMLFQQAELELLEAAASELRQEERVILLSGATGGGLGQAMLRALVAEQGEKRNVIYAVVRDTSKGKALFPDVPEEKLIFLPMSLEDPTGPAEVVAQIEQKHGAVDVLLNCAGMGRNWPLECETENTMMECINVNLMGPIRLSKAVMPGMKTKGSGHIINVTSIGGLVADEMTEMYNAAKYGLTGFSESLVLTARHFGIKVTAVSPGPMNTPSLWSSVVKDYDRSLCDSKTQELIDAKFPLMEGLKDMQDKIAQPDQAAQLVMSNVVNNQSPELFYIMNFGYCQERLDSKFQDLQVYGQTQHEV